MPYIICLKPRMRVLKSRSNIVKVPNASMQYIAQVDMSPRLVIRT